MGNSNQPGSKAAKIKCVAEQKKRRKGEGYAYFSVELRPDSAAALAAIRQQTGESKNAVVNRAVLALTEK